MTPSPSRTSRTRQPRIQRRLADVLHNPTRPTGSPEHEQRLRLALDREQALGARRREVASRRRAEANAERAARAVPTVLPRYTDEMSARAKAYIAERDAIEDAELVFQRYAEVCWRSFQRRRSRELSGVSVGGSRLGMARDGRKGAVAGGAAVDQTN